MRVAFVSQPRDPIVASGVERGDVEALAQALHRALTDPMARSGMRHAARSQAEATFGWQLASARLARTHDNLTGAVRASA